MLRLNDFPDGILGDVARNVSTGNFFCIIGLRYIVGYFCLMVLSRRHNVTSLRVGCVGITISYRAASIATFWAIRLLIVSVEDY